jgi:hypothetical protein
LDYTPSIYSATRSDLDHDYVSREAVAEVLNQLYARRDNAIEAYNDARLSATTAHLCGPLMTRQNTLQECITALAPLGVR